MARLFPFWHRSPDSVPVLTLAERRLLLGVLFLFALGLAARGLQLRAAHSSASQESQQIQQSSQPGASP